MVKREHVVGTTGPFLRRANASFDVRNVLVLPADVQVGVKVGGDSATGTFKFGVGNHELDTEAPFAVQPVDALQRFHERLLLAVVENLGGDESNISRERHEKWDPVDGHDVNAESDVTIV